LSAEAPLGIDYVTFGVAHMPLAQQEAFHSLLREIGRGATPESAGPSLERVLAGARRVAFLSMQLQAGQRG
jgi:hypothetical protein